ncbi:MAG: quinol:electron acceptor oxidoreductase subunit ActD [Chloroflexota bacterium]|jgi:hypothetical protein|nr:quinol:electron acceptor oxidoreductase subunit ActD [Chloroflexota bacterium]
MLNMLKQKSIIGVYTDENTAADALDALNSAGYETNEYEILTGTPYPEGTFGEHEPKHTLYRWPLIGAACGFIVGLMLTVGTQLAYPLVTGGKPVLGIPPMAIIMYEGTMLGAILFTIIGILFESRLPRLFMGAYDTRITEGYIGITVTTSPERIEKAEQVLQNSGAQDISKGWE